MSFRVLGTGRCLPERAVTNAELERFVDTSDEWIRQRVGVAERRVCTTETAADLAAGAAEAALQMSGVAARELDFILCATITPDDLSPSLACMVQSRIGASCPAMDVSAACSGFVYALETAAAFFARGRVKKVLVIGAERLSRIVDWSDRNTCIIFGDGAGAMVLEEGDNYLASKLTARGCDAVLKIPAFGGASPFWEGGVEKPYIRMNGQETFKFAVGAMVSDLEEVIAAAGLEPEDIAWVIAHQANARIIDAAARKLGIPFGRFAKNIDRYGNTSAASIPILADELCRDGHLKDGDYIALTSFGGGLTSAACVLRWGP
ncbi:MAG: ketoacyl-ACP synthase III [Clostridiales bacterium]|nr:ketoacyl-ACP synthase III [Clostridiales bacterium]